MYRVGLIVLLTPCFAVAAIGQTLPSTTLHPAQARKLATPAISDALISVQAYIAKIGASHSYEITGDQAFSGQTLAADTIVFNPDSQLRFVGTWGDRAERYLVAQKIIVLQGHSPPRITWLNENDRRIPPAMGKAGPGRLAGSDGVKGGRGEPGSVGNPGYPGRSAPTVYIFVARIEGGPIIVDLPGQDGGKGGQGQSGGDGGPGRSGSQAVTGVFGCQHGAEDGGDGGDGGNGGNGGTGGAGGNGGTLIVVGRERLVEHLSESFVVNLLPGNPGPGGDPGAGGVGGPPGQGGGGNGTCPIGKSGNPGHSGTAGQLGISGSAGEPGFFAEAPLTDQQMKNLGLSAK